MPGPCILILDFSSIKGKVIEKPLLEIKAEIEELEAGKCKVCTALPPFVQEKVKFEANDDLKAFALSCFNYFCKGKGL